jgi:hypothetical protein
MKKEQQNRANLQEIPLEQMPPEIEQNSVNF